MLHQIQNCEFLLPSISKGITIFLRHKKQHRTKCEFIQSFSLWGKWITSQSSCSSVASFCVILNVLKCIKSHFLASDPILSIFLVIRVSNIWCNLRNELTLKYGTVALMQHAIGLVTNNYNYPNKCSAVKADGCRTWIYIL